VVAARPVEMPQVATAYHLCGPHAMSRSQKGTIFGHISFVMETMRSHRSYTDLAVAFISVWLDAILKVLAGQKITCGCGSITIPIQWMCRIGGWLGAAGVHLAQRRDGPTDRIHAHAAARTAAAIHGGRRAHPQRVRAARLDDPDIQMLAANLKRGARRCGASGPDLAWTGHESAQVRAIPLSAPDITHAEIDAVTAVLRTRT